MLVDSRHRESRGGGLLRRIRLWVIIILLATIGYFGAIKFEWSRPAAHLRRPLEYLSRQAEIPLDVADWGTGLASVDLAVEGGGALYPVLWGSLQWNVR